MKVNWQREITVQIIGCNSINANNMSNLMSEVHLLSDLVLNQQTAHIKCNERPSYAWQRKKIIRFEKQSPSAPKMKEKKASFLPLLWDSSEKMDYFSAAG